MKKTTGLEGHTKMACGACGHSKHRLFMGANMITTVCCKCKAQSVITVTAKLNVDWGDYGDGCITTWE